MQPIKYKPTGISPLVHFDSNAGVLEIKGRSIPEHPSRFFRPLLDWVEKYVNTTPRTTTVSIFMDYINSSSKRYMLELVDRLRPLQQQGLKVCWYYEEDDEEILQTGEDLSFQTRVNFDFIPVEDILT